MISTCPTKSKFPRALVPRIQSAAVQGMHGLRTVGDEYAFTDPEVPDARLVFVVRIDFTSDEKRRLGDLHRKHHRPDAVDPDGRYIATDMKSWWSYSFRSRDGEPFIFKDPYIRLNSADRAIIIKAIESYMGMGPYAD